MVGQPEQYRWSSYAAYIGTSRTPHWLTTYWLLQYFGKKTSDARNAYRFFVEAALSTSGEDPLKEATATLILGKAEFIEEIREKYLGGKKRERDIPSLRELRKTSLEAIMKAIEQGFRDKSGYERRPSI